MRHSVGAVEIRARAEQHRPAPGVDIWRACTPLYTIMTAVAATTCVVLLNLLLVGELSYFFDLCFVVICLVAGLMARPGEAWNVALVPPILLVATVCFLAALSPGTVAEADDGTVQAIITGVTTHSGALLVGFALFGLALWTGASNAPRADAFEYLDGVDEADARDEGEPLRAAGPDVDA